MKTRWIIYPALLFGLLIFGWWECRWFALHDFFFANDLYHQHPWLYHALTFPD
jgi:hypothetical protein